MVGGVTRERGVAAADGGVMIYCTKLQYGGTTLRKDLHNTVQLCRRCLLEF